MLRGPQFEGLHPLAHVAVGETQQVPVEALHDTWMHEYGVNGRDIEAGYRQRHEDIKTYGDAPHPNDSPEAMHALTEDVRRNGVQTPLRVTRHPQQRGPVHYAVADGTHRYLAAVRAGRSHVPITMSW